MVDDNLRTMCFQSLCKVFTKCHSDVLHPKEWKDEVDGGIRKYAFSFCVQIPDIFSEVVLAVLLSPVQSIICAKRVHDLSDFLV